MSISARPPLAALLACPVAAASAGEAWTAVNLRPAGSALGQVYSVHAGRQAGIASFGGLRAGFWNGSARTWVDLDGGAFPFGSSAAAVHDGQVVGSVGAVNEKGDDFTLAALWNGSAEAYVSLHPDLPGVTQSIGHAVHGGQQGGVVRFDDTQNRAALWSGSAATLVDLHPEVADDSYVHGMWDGMQVGYATGIPFSHACLWRGDARSWVDLHPGQTGADASQAVGTDGQQQVGWIIFLDGLVVDHPAVWSGTAASVVDLLPTNWRDGKALGVFEGRQIGYARPSLGVEYRALVWDGDGDSYVDLHQFLPPGRYIRSTGYGIWNDGEHWYAVGQAIRPGFVSDPIMWVAPMPEPPCPFDLDDDGAVGVADLVALFGAWGDPYGVPDLVDLIGAWGVCP